MWTQKVDPQSPSNHSLNELELKLRTLWCQRRRLEELMRRQSAKVESYLLSPRPEARPSDGVAVCESKVKLVESEIRYLAVICELADVEVSQRETLLDTLQSHVERGL